MWVSLFSIHYKQEALFPTQDLSHGLVCKKMLFQLERAQHHLLAQSLDAAYT